MTRAWLRDQLGATLVWFALTVPVLFGMAGIGVESTLWHMDKRSQVRVLPGAPVFSMG